jgi:hypothetical protein
MTAITPPPTPTLEALFLIAYALLDDLYRERAPDHVRFRPGYDRCELSDAEVLTLSVMQEALSIDSETAFIRFMRRNYLALFPQLAERSRYHRRRKALTSVQQVLFGHLAARFAEAAAWLVVDSAPVETTKVERSQTGQRSIPEAAYHVRPSRGQLFFGFRLHLAISDEGAILDFALAPANLGEREVAEGLLSGVGPAETGLVLGDTGYSGENMNTMAEGLGHVLWALPKRSRAAGDAESRRWRRWVRRHRALIETVFSMLADQFRVETTRARSLWGVWTRVLAKVLAFNLSLHVNRLLGRPLLAVKSLYL